MDRKIRTRRRILGIRLAIQSSKFIAPLSMPFPVDCINVLVIAPHFDDELIGCAGVLAEHIKHNHTCSVLYLTNGKGGALQEYDSDTRQYEASLGLNHIGNIRSLYFDIPDGELCNNLGYAQNLADELVSAHYHRIYFPNPEDSYSDHACAGKLLSIALNITGQQPELYAYEIVELIKNPNTYFEISSYDLLKAISLKEHNSQHNYLDYTKISLEINKLRGEQLKCEVCEAYRKFSVIQLYRYYFNIQSK